MTHRAERHKAFCLVTDGKFWDFSTICNETASQI